MYFFYFSPCFTSLDVIYLYIFRIYIFLPMALKIVKLTQEAKENLDWLKKHYAFKSFSILINTLAEFFKGHSIDPRDKPERRFASAVENMETQLTKKFKNLQYKIAKESKKNQSLEGKMANFFEAVNTEKNLTQSSQELVNLRENIFSLEGKIKDLEQKNTALESANRRELQLVQNQEKKLSELDQVVQKIKGSIREKKRLGKTRHFIDLSREEISQVFENIK